MKKPKRRNSAINAQRIRAWENEYANYRYAVSEHRIHEWMGQFAPDHRDLSARVLDCTEVITHDQIAAAYRSILAGLGGWDKVEARREGKWRFVAYSASAGESGDSMLHQFRIANNLAGHTYDELFIHRSDLLREELGPDDHVVFIDDFVGSGDQACKSWGDVFGELVANIGRVYLVVVAAREQAMQRIRTETDLELVSQIYLMNSDNVFDSACKYFNNDEKHALLTYCEKVDSKKPKGHGDCGLLLVFAHTCPNNSIPILHKSKRNWEPLFRRYD